MTWEIKFRSSTSEKLQKFTGDDKEIQKLISNLMKEYDTVRIVMKKGDQNDN